MLNSRSLAGFALALFALIAVPAHAMDCPGGMEPTVASLRACVQHAAEMGMIDNAGVATSLLAKLDAAQAALDRDGPNAHGTAVNLLEAFVNEVEAQAGKHVDAAHAEHMVMHARKVIDALALAWLSESVTTLRAGGALAGQATLARTYFAVADVPATCAALAAFDAQARSQAGTVLAAAAADRLVGYSQSIQRSIGCR